MVSERDVQHIAELADIGIDKEELEEFTGRFNEILTYFDILDKVPLGEPKKADLVNIFREDVVESSLPHDEVLANTLVAEDGFFRAPRVM
jgi:aspartyl-tRNA(Asn)/glutamyl-tRNA(Gln) amidotransferase subunit C